MAVYRSFERALFDGDINGPNWPVIDSDSGQPANPSSQEYGHTVLGRNVELLSGFILPMTVTDFTEPSDQPVLPWHEDQDPRIRLVS